MTTMRFLLLLLLLLPGPAFAAGSNIFSSSRDTVQLVSQSNAASDGQIMLGLKFQLAPGWHIYWSNPGDAGFAPQVTLDPPANAGPLSYPPPEFLLQGTVAAYVLSGNILLPFAATGIGDKVSLKAGWLVCSDICVPEQAAFALDLQGGNATEAMLFGSPRIVPSPFAAHIAPDGALTIAGLTPTQVHSARFFPDQQNIIVNRAPQRLKFGPDGLTLQLDPVSAIDAKQSLTGVLELTDPSGAMQALRLTAALGPDHGPPPPIAEAATPLILWLGFAFLGGLILNLMPCVFPVLAMKAFAITRFSGAGKAHIRREALGYTAGVLTAMLAIGLILILLRALGGDFGWGFQFQSPVFVALTAWLILAIGLNLAGLFEVSVDTRFLGRFAQRGSFFTGLLAVITATPCTAPFMGGAIAAALAAPVAAAIGIFLCLGLGLAAPFLLLAILPALAQRLPRPGRWMIVLQRLLSIPMFATFLWLAWVMLRETGFGGFVFLLCSALLLGLALSVKPFRPAAILALIALPFLHHTQPVASLSLPNAEPYSADRLAAYRAANTPAFIDLTAAWCVTCLVNERTTLANAAVQSGFAKNHVHIMVGDWTQRDPQITRLLQQNNRDGVPLYMYYPANAAPRMLPQILTPQIVLDALAK